MERGFTLETLLSILRQIDKEYKAGKPIETDSLAVSWSLFYKAMQCIVPFNEQGDLLVQNRDLVTAEKVSVERVYCCLKKYLR